MVSKVELVNKLMTGVFDVEFTKVNGERRVMPATLMAEHLPPKKPIDESRAPRKDNPEVIAVFCMDKKEWRSFRIDSVISINPSEYK